MQDMIKQRDYEEYMRTPLLEMTEGYERKEETTTVNFIQLRDGRRLQTIKHQPACGHFSRMANRLIFDRLRHN